MTLLERPKIFDPFTDLVALQTTRHGGISPKPFDSLNLDLGTNTADDPSNILLNRQLLCRRIGIDPSSLVTAGQIHGTKICHAITGGHYSGYDAFITKQKDLFLCILTADCFPVLVYDHKNKAAGAAHAGWKGTAENISGMTIEAMNKQFGTLPSHCRVWIGTGISGNAYEVGREVASRFNSKYLTSSGEGRFLLDLASVNIDQMLEKGIPPASIEASPFCTARNNSDFFSYRKESGTTGRMLSLIGLRSKSRTP